MKKILDMMVICLMLCGCQVNNIEANLKDYNMSIDNFFGMSSYKIDVVENNVTRRLNDNDEIVGEIYKIKINNVLIDNDNNAYYIKEKNDNSGYDTEIWFNNGTVYFNNDGYKLTYNDTFENFEMRLIDNTGIIPVYLERNDVERIKTVKLDSKVTYEFSLNDSGKKKVLEENSYFGYGKSFKLEDSNFEYKVTVMENYIYEISVLGEFKGDAIDGKNNVFVNENIKISGINQIFVDIPMDSASYVSSVIEDDKEFGVTDIDGYKLYLKEAGYNDNFVLAINDLLSFKYDFENSVYISVDNGIAYSYDFKENIGNVNECRFDFNTGEVSEGFTCTIKEKYELINSKNSFMYDINNSGIDIEILKGMK